MKFPKIQWDTWVIAIIIGIIVNVPPGNHWVDRVSLPWLVVISVLLGLALIVVHRWWKGRVGSEEPSEE